MLSIFLPGFFNFAKDNKVSFFLKPVDTLPVPSITVTEIFKHVLYLRREEPSLEIIAHMIQGEVISLDTQISINVRNYGFEHKLPQVDGIIYAITIRHSASLWTCLFPSYALLICSQELLIRYTDELTTPPIYRAIVII
jgi:predicted nucleic acid-binding protein